MIKKKVETLVQSRYLSVGVCLLVQQLVEFEHIVTEDSVVEGSALLLPVDPLKLSVKGRRLSTRVWRIKLLVEALNICFDMLKCQKLNNSLACHFSAKYSCLPRQTSSSRHCPSSPALEHLGPSWRTSGCHLHPEEAKYHQIIVDNLLTCLVLDVRLVLISVVLVLVITQRLLQHVFGFCFLMP